MNIIAFGIIAEKTGNATLSFANCNNLETLKAMLFQEFPELKELSFLISVNRKIIHGNMQLNEGDEIALLPPFSGG